MKNNLNLILPLLRFDLGSYHVQILQRSKDGHDKATRLICEWFVTSESHLGLLMPGIELLCACYNARCYININPKKDETVCWEISDSILKRIKTKSFKPLSILSHAHDSCQGNEVKYWVIDIDNMAIDFDRLRFEINKCRSGFAGNKIVAELPSKSGIHFITHPFDLSTFSFFGIKTNDDIKKNASTILYCL